ncbi:hypothetical protein FKM82_029553 [Ascaphus truei]
MSACELSAYVWSDVCSAVTCLRWRVLYLVECVFVGCMYGCKGRYVSCVCVYGVYGGMCGVYVFVGCVSSPSMWMICCGDVD